MTDEEYRQQVEQRWKETMSLLGVDDAGPAPEVAKVAEQPQPKLRPVVQAELPISGREWEPVPNDAAQLPRQLRFLQSCTRQRNRTSKQHKLHRPMMNLATTEPAARGADAEADVARNHPGPSAQTWVRARNNRQRAVERRKAESHSKVQGAVVAITGNVRRKMWRKRLPNRMNR